MRVLFLTGEFPPMQGGVGDCTNEIAQALTARGVEPHVLTTALPTSNFQLPISNFPVHRLVTKWNWRALGIIRRVAREIRADIIHAQYQTAAFGMHPAINFLPFVFKSRAKYVITYHDLRPPYLFPKAGRVRDWVTFFPARHSDAVIATNEQDYARLARLNLQHLTLIPIGSNIAPNPPCNYDRHAWRAQHGIGENDLLLCYFGFLNDSKGGMDLMRALAFLPNAKLMMVGGQLGASDATNAAYLAHVKNLITELGLNERVVWTDYTPAEQVSANLLAADVCVLPYSDGVSFRRGSFMAALAHGLAIVTTLSPNPLPTKGEGVTDGENVLLVPPENPRALADAVTRLAHDDALREKIRAGAKQLAQNFTWDKIAARHLDLYKQLLESDARAIKPGRPYNE